MRKRWEIKIGINVSLQAPPETTALKRDVSSLEAETTNLQAQLRGSLKELHQKELRIQQLNSKVCCGEGVAELGFFQKCTI